MGRYWDDSYLSKHTDLLEHPKWRAGRWINNIIVQIKRHNNVMWAGMDLVDCHGKDPSYCSRCSMVSGQNAAGNHPPWLSIHLSLVGQCQTSHILWHHSSHIRPLLLDLLTLWCQNWWICDRFYRFDEDLPCCNALISSMPSFWRSEAECGLSPQIQRIIIIIIMIITTTIITITITIAITMGRMAFLLRRSIWPMELLRSGIWKCQLQCTYNISIILYQC